MVSVCFYFQVHQPYRLRKYGIFDIGNRRDYFSESGDNNLNNEKILRKVADKCYIPATKVLLEIIKENPGFRVSFSFSGIVLEQLESYAPEALDLFKQLVATGNVEILDETYYHSISFLYDKEEFKRQVEMHRKKIQEVFGVTPRVFRNTELIYNNELADFIDKMGYDGILAEGADHILGWKSPHYVYSPLNSSIGLLLKSYKLSDDIAFRFSNQGWQSWPLKAETYAHWLSSINGSGEVINLFMDYETFGEHQWSDTGIFEFMKALPGEFLKNPDNNFMTPSEVIKAYPKRGELDIHNFISWADIERDLSAWMGNTMQHSALKQIYELGKEITLTNDKKLIEDWRRLQTSDHFYYMCTKWFNDGDVHKYFNPYESPYDAFISYMNALQDLKLRVEEIVRVDDREKDLDNVVKEVRVK